MTSEFESDQRSWFVTSRWSELEGELRAAVMRVVFVIAFYSVQLLHYSYSAAESGGEALFHRNITMIAAGWLFVSLIIMTAVMQHWFPPWLKYVSSGCDVALLTAAAYIGNGPDSPLVPVYAVVIAMAGLRFSLPLIWCTTIACLIGYLTLVGAADQTWFDPNHVTPPTQTLTTLLSLAAVGITVGQFVRMSRRAAEQYASRRLISGGES